MKTANWPNGPNSAKATIKAKAAKMARTKTRFDTNDGDTNDTT